MCEITSFVFFVGSILFSGSFCPIIGIIIVFCILLYSVFLTLVLQLSSVLSLSFTASSLLKALASVPFFYTLRFYFTHCIYTHIYTWSWFLGGRVFSAIFPFWSRPFYHRTIVVLERNVNFLLTTTVPGLALILLCAMKSTCSKSAVCCLLRLTPQWSIIWLVIHVV